MRKTFSSLLNLANQADSILFNKNIFQVVITDQGNLVWANTSALAYLKKHPENIVENINQIPEIGSLFQKAIEDKSNIITYIFNDEPYVAVFYYSSYEGNEKHVLISIEKATPQDKMLFLKDRYKADHKMMILLNKEGMPIYISDAYLENFKEETWDQNYILKNGELEEISFCLNDASESRVLKRNKERNIVLLHRDSVPLYSDNQIIGHVITYSFESEDIFKYSHGQTFRDIIYNIVDGVLIASKDLVTLWANKAMQEITGYDSEELVGVKVGAIKSGIHDQRFYDNMWKKLSQGLSWEGIIWNKKKTGEVFPSWLQIIAVKTNDEEISHYVAIYKDLSEYDSPNKKLLVALEKDPLTNIYNRTYFIEQVTSLIENPENTGTVLFIDVDNFKKINDEHGHLIGDKLLLEVAKTLTQLYPEGVIARYGGDEFIVYLPGECSKEDALEKLANLTSQTIYINGEDYELELSVGFAHHKNANKTLLDLIQEADKSMYKIKNNKKTNTISSSL